MMLLASLPMYDLPEVRQETDDLWQLLATHMRRSGVKDVPVRLNRDAPYEAVWSNPDLLVSQTCGYPLVSQYQRTLRPLATPRYGVEGCGGADYSSVILVPLVSEIRGIAQLRGKVCAVSSPHSHSGYNALRALIAPLSLGNPYFSDVKITGGHRKSIDLVAAGEADVCAVDCVTYALFCRYAPETTEGTRVLDFTDRCPGLPLVVRRDLEDDQFNRLRAAIREAMADPGGRDARGALFIEGVTETEIDDYRAVLALEARADALGYGEIR